MLTEQFIASVGAPNRPAAANAVKDAGIFIHEYQPLNAQRQVLKKSATAPNCLASNSTHIFAAQADKAVVHVYGREKGNHEATVPFTERITSVTLICEESVLVLGTVEGRIFLWEIASGRQITTSQSHLQDVTVVVADAASTFLLSGSADSTIHVWSIPHLLSFSNSGSEPLLPLRTFSSHKSRINALAVGHSASFCNFAVSASSDQTCLIWDYQTQNILRTILLSSIPLCLALDPADRAIYVGSEDGKVQQIDLFALENSRGSKLSNVHNSLNGTAPIQLPASSTWRSADTSVGAANCLTVSFDGTTVLTGHESGAVLAWEVARGASPTALLPVALPAAVTNLEFLPVTGFAQQRCQNFKIPFITKPKFGAFDSSNGAVPNNYGLNVELVSELSSNQTSTFEKALYSASFPAELLDEGLYELLHWGKQQPTMESQEEQEEAEDFLALDGGEKPKSIETTLQEQNASLRAEVEALRRLQKVSFDKIDHINAERQALVHRERQRLENLGSRDSASQLNGSLHLPDDSD